MNIITSYFAVKRIEGSLFIGEQSLRYQRARQQEYVDCVALNALNPQVRSITLLIEGPDGYDHFLRTFTRALAASAEGGHLPASFTASHQHKIVPLLYTPTARNTTGRPMPVYGDFFDLAGRLFPGQLCMIANADVYLSHRHCSVPALRALFDAGSVTGRVAAVDDAHKGSGPHPLPCTRLALALTRHERDDTGVDAAPLIEDYRGSHDAFVVRAPVPPTLVDRLRHPQNCYQAENIVIHELQQHGYVVLNPCRDLRLVHRHAADVRQWLPSVDPTRYGRAAPMTLEQCRAALLKR